MIAIIKYNAGNATSVKHALTRLGEESVITDDKEIIRNASRVIFPGAGRASTAMTYLREKELDSLILGLTQPVLGICLGLQLMCSFSEEDATECLGIFDVVIKKFPPKDKVPHMGWNNLSTLKGPLFEGIQATDNLYFVHSFYAAISPETLSEGDYILPFSAALQKNNFYAIQFHPENQGSQVKFY